MTRRWVVLLVGLAFGCGDDDGPDEDAGSDAAAIECTATSDCDDGTFCNGEETCDPSDPSAGADGCVGASPPCGTMACDEDADACDDSCPDLDGDGQADVACGGMDCDDDDPNRFVGNTEVCDAMNRDEDCDPRTFGFRDADMDGEADALCCNDDLGTLVCGSDCDDARPTVNTTATEACDTLDNDCDGTADEGALTTYFEDADGDGFGVDDGATMSACAQPPGFAEMAGDCNDGESSINPGVPERCEAGGIDENCNMMVSEGCACSEGETRPCSLPGACAAGVESCDSGTWSETCSIEAEDEGPVCDGIDNNCDGATDEGLLDTCYSDVDRDGYAPVGATVTEACGCPMGTTDRPPFGADADCDDSDENVNPGAAEICNRIDDDCSSGGGVDVSEDVDNDGFARSTADCLGGFPKTDCNDAERTVFPGQTRHFSVAYCAGTHQARTYCFGGAAWCGSCMVVPPLAGPPTEFDFDCDGMDEPQPAASTCEADSTLWNCANPPTRPVGCTGDGPTVAVTPADCGRAVSYQDCVCGSMVCQADTGMFPGTLRRPLACQ